MNIYIAAPFFNPEQISFILDIEIALDRSDIHYYSPRKGGSIAHMNKEEVKQSKRDIYISNIDAIAESDKIVAVIDDRDTGTIWEMGYAVGLGIPVISISGRDYGVNIMLAESIQAHTKNTNDMIKAIFDDSYTGVEITDLF